MKVTKILGLAAVGALLVLAAPSQSAQAMSLSNPAAAAAVRDDAGPAVIQAGWHRHWHHHWHRRWHRR